MNAVAYILTRKPEADAAYLNAQGVPISVKDNVDGTRFLDSQCRTDTCPDTCTT